jgi:hypothetical protein
LSLSVTLSSLVSEGLAAGGTIPAYIHRILYREIVKKSRIIFEVVEGKREAFASLGVYATHLTPRYVPLVSCGFVSRLSEVHRKPL